MNMRILEKIARRTNRVGAIATASALAVALGAGGCAWKQERDQARAEKQQLAEKVQKLQDSLQSTRSESVEANAILDEVQKGLEEIRAKELKVVRSSIRVAQEGTAADGKRDQLESEILTIRDAIHRNLQKLAQLEKINRGNGVRVASLEKLAGDLKLSLEAKDAMLSELQGKVTDLSKTVESQTMSLAEKEAAINQAETRIAEQAKNLNTAYVAVASKSLLRKKGLVEKKGSILGLGGRWIETGKFDPGVFREIDVTRELEVSIPAPASKVSVVTEQPKGSYQIVDAGPHAKSSKLEVKDPAAFWRGDKYLVVMIPD
jgi:chromosome segregation ATPase